MNKKLIAGLAFWAAFSASSFANAQVKIGITGPLTGSAAAFGKQIADGAEQAVADFNAKGGILGKKIEAIKGDDAGDPKQGVAVANKLVGDGVKFVVGPFNSGVAMPSSEVYSDNDVLIITPAATNPRITERGLWNVFRTCGRDDQQGAVAAEYIINNLKDKKIAIVHDKTTYGQGLADETKKAINNAGIKEIFYDGINAGEKDFSALVTKIKIEGADLVYWGGYHTEGGLILRQMREQGLKSVMMSGDAIASDEFALIAGPGVEGTLMTFAPDPRKKSEAKEVVELYKSKGMNPEAYTLYSYASMQVIKQAAESANSLEPKKVADKIHSGMVFKTVIGDLSYDKKGDVTRPDFVVYSWKKDSNGKVVYEEIATQK